MYSSNIIISGEFERLAGAKFDAKPTTLTAITDHIDFPLLIGLFLWLSLLHCHNRSSTSLLALRSFRDVFQYHEGATLKEIIVYDSIQDLLLTVIRK